MEIWVTTAPKALLGNRGQKASQVFVVSKETQEQLVNQVRLDLMVSRDH